MSNSEKSLVLACCVTFLFFYETLSNILGMDFFTNILFSERKPEIRQF